MQSKLCHGEWIYHIVRVTTGTQRRSSKLKVAGKESEELHVICWVEEEDKVGYLMHYIK